MRYVLTFVVLLGGYRAVAAGNEETALTFDTVSPLVLSLSTCRSAQIFLDAYYSSGSVHCWSFPLVIPMGNYESVMSPACCDNSSHRRGWRDESRRRHEIYINFCNACPLSEGVKTLLRRRISAYDITAKRWKSLHLNIARIIQLFWDQIPNASENYSSRWTEVEWNPSYRGLEPEDRWGLGCYSALLPSGLARRIKAEAYGGRCEDETASEFDNGWHQQHTCACSKEHF